MARVSRAWQTPGVRKLFINLGWGSLRVSVWGAALVAAVLLYERVTQPHFALPSWSAPLFFASAFVSAIPFFARRFAAGAQRHP